MFYKNNKPGDKYNQHQQRIFYKHQIFRLSIEQFH